MPIHRYLYVHIFTIGLHCINDLVGPLLSISLSPLPALLLSLSFFFLRGITPACIKVSTAHAGTYKPIMTPKYSALQHDIRGIFSYLLARKCLVPT